ncbi:Unconventional myosin-Ig, partial [Perkinsus olseni]
MASITTPPAAAGPSTVIKKDLQWLHNVKVTSPQVRHDADICRIIEDVGKLCDIEFEGDSVMEDKVLLLGLILPFIATTSTHLQQQYYQIIPRNGWRLSIATLPSPPPPSEDGPPTDLAAEVSKGSMVDGQRGLAAFMVYRIDGSKREMHIGQMAVVPIYRGMGVGGAAIRLLKDMA